MAQKNTDQQIIEDIRSGGSPREIAWRYISENWGGYCLGTAMKVSRCDAKQAAEAFSVAVVGTDKRIRGSNGQDFLKTATLKSYLTQSTIYAAWEILGKKNKHEELKEGNLPREDTNDWFRQMNCREIMEKSLAVVGERCKKILLLFNDNFSMKEIADEMSFANEDVAKKEKYRCQGNFKDYLRTNPQTRNLLRENCYG